MLWIGLIGIVGCALVLSAIDIREHRLPNRIVGPLAGAVAVWLLVLGVANRDLERTGVAFLWGFAVMGIFFVLAIVAGLGMGDVKFAWPLAATIGWFGSAAVQTAMLGLVVSGGIVGVIALAARRDTKFQLPYGPFMTIGLICGLLHGLSL